MIRPLVILLAVAAIIVLSLAMYRYHSRDRLNVTPDAAREIEKAKRR
jgi:hypothetical protein